MSFLCDTNIISELARPRPNPGVLDWIRNVTSINISVITLEEIIYGLAAKPNQRIQTWFQDFLQNYCTILPITTQIASQAGELRGELRKRGKQRTQADVLIAITAKVYQQILVSRNVRDFQDCDVQILNPFSETL